MFYLKFVPVHLTPWSYANYYLQKGMEKKTSFHHTKTEKIVKCTGLRANVAKLGCPKI